jgi:hypothetical protein
MTERDHLLAITLALAAGTALGAPASAWQTADSI